MRYMIHIASFLVGALMAAGLAVAGMTQPHKVVGFLDFFGRWDPDLMLVMVGAVVITFVLYRLLFRRGRPLLAPRFLVPTRRDVDARLISGAMLFGVGWGLTGICPGPAIASVATGSAGVMLFLMGMTVGMYVLGLYERLQAALQARLRRQPAYSPEG